MRRAGIITSILEWTLDKIALSTAASSSSPSPSALQELEQLRSMMAEIHATLNDAEERDIDDGYSETLRLTELKEVAYDAEDAVGEYDYEVLRARGEGRRGHAEHRLHKHKGTQGEVCCLPPAPSQVLIPDELICRVRKIRERFDEITREWGRLSFPDRITKKRRLRAWPPRETAKLALDGSTIFGRAAEKGKIMKWLLSSNENDEGPVSVLPIVGMGGMGKTTLAQIALNDLRVSRKFDLEGWVCVAQESDPVNLTRTIAICLTGTNVPSMDMKALHEVLAKKVKGKTFLLVLDDVWNDQVDLWEPLVAPLLGAKLGKIIVTTRSMSVARLMHTVPPIQLTELSFGACWLLFSKVALEGRDPVACKELEDIGSKIVIRCKGLPLAVRAIGATLRQESDEMWLEVLESELWDLDQVNGSQILPALKLSYDCMPAHLKWCFASLCLFPKGYAFDEERIIYLWMSQGLLRPQVGKVELKIGSDYLNDLIQRSLLQPYRNKRDAFVMHDLIHDLVKSVAADEYAQIGMTDVLSINVRHMSLLLNNKTTPLNFEEILKYRHLRTLIILIDKSYAPDIVQNLQIPDGSFHDMKCLRALDLRSIKIRELPGSIVSAKNLRYICLQGTSIESIPESLCCLYNLQILDVDNTDVIEIPKQIKKLVNLRCLRFNVILNVCMPSEIGELTNLQELSAFNVRRGSWHCKLAELKKLVNLSGLLMIDGLTNNEYFDFSPQEPYLKMMENVDHLRLLWKSSVFEIKKCTHHDNLSPEEDNVDQFVSRKKIGSMITNDEVAELVLESLHPHTSLKKLVINHYTGTHFASWLGEVSFSQLTAIELNDCNCMILPPFGQLPSLKILMIRRMENVQRVGCKFCTPAPNTIPKAFPSLGYLYFSDMLKWEEWDGLEHEDFPCLQSLTLKKCPMLTKFPNQLIFSLLTDLRILQCDKLDRLPALPSLSRLELRAEWNCIFFSSGISCAQCFGNTLTLRCRLLPSLKELSITRCSKLRALIGFGNLASLKLLEIFSCQALEVSENEKLPSELTVTIRNSPGAKKWCQNVMPNMREVLPDFFVASTSPSYDPWVCIHWIVPEHLC